SQVGVAGIVWFGQPAGTAAKEEGTMELSAPQMPKRCENSPVRAGRAQDLEQIIQEQRHVLQTAAVIQEPTITSDKDKELNDSGAEDISFGGNLSDSGSMTLQSETPQMADVMIQTRSDVMYLLFWQALQLPLKVVLLDGME
ncbi:hypothetical protein NDU88_003200, partial [Pleurodeles waltl]